MPAARNSDIAGSVLPLTRTPAAWLQLLDALEWCFDLSVSVVTVYAFSIENFKVRGKPAVSSPP